MTSLPARHANVSIKKQSEEFYQVLRQHLKEEHAHDPKIAEFIIKYMSCRNAPQAAQEVGLSRADGRYLFQQTDIYTVIQKLTEDAVVKHGYDAAEIVERTKEIAFFDPADLVTEDGKFIEDINLIPPEARRAIKKLVCKNIFEDDINGVPQYRGKVITYEFWDKPKTLELLAREKDTFKKTTVVEHDVSKNARSYLLASLELANNGGELPAPIDVTPVQIGVDIAKPDSDRTVVSSINESKLTVSSIPKPPGVL